MADLTFRTIPTSEGLSIQLRRGAELLGARFISTAEIKAAEADGRAVEELITAAGAELQREFAGPDD
jgi:hypothetical protein